MHLHFGECPDKPTAKNKTDRRKPEKQIGSGHAGFWLKQIEEAVALAKRMHADLLSSAKKLRYRSKTAANMQRYTDKEEHTRLSGVGPRVLGVTPREEEVPSLTPSTCRAPV